MVPKLLKERREVSLSVTGKEDSFKLQLSILSAASILVVKAMPMHNGIQAAVHAGFMNTVVEGDNKILIQAMKGQMQAAWQIQTLLQDIQTDLQKCQLVTITHIFRQGNSATDWLVKRGLSLQSPLVWEEVPHRDLSFIFYEDNLGRTLERRTS